MKTIVLKVDPTNPCPTKLEKAVAALKAGKLVAFPTDTVYGIGADIFNDEAVRSIFTVKKRNPGKPLQALVAHRSDFRAIAKNWSEMLDRLVSEFCPGALTLVMLARDDFPRQVRCGRNTIGVRMPANPVALKLIESFGAPIAATSANISGFSDPASAGETMKYLGGKVELILDGGVTPGSIPSTVLDVSVSPPVTLRQGKLSAEELNRVLSITSIVPQK